jgi:polysaccharide biosynthesis protein PslG
MRRIGLSVLVVLVLVLATACVAPNARVTQRGRVGDKVGFAFYGGQLSDAPASRNADLDRARAAGAKWVRLSLNWITLEPRRKGEFNWGPADALVAAATSRGLRVLGQVSYTPAWARNGGNEVSPPRNANDFGDFMAAAARRYGPRGVHAWEIWNEPNMISMWSPRPNVGQYTALLKAAYPKIKAADRGATVVTGGFSPAYDAGDGSQMLPLTFLRGIYANGGRGYFDAVGHHPSSFPSPSTLKASWNAFQQSTALHNEMAAHGDGYKQIWATELSFPTGNSADAVSETTQGARLAEAVTAWRAWSFTGPLFIYSLRDQGTNGDRYNSAGIYRLNGSPKASVPRVTSTLHASS